MGDFPGLEVGTPPTWWNRNSKDEGLKMEVNLKSPSQRFLLTSRCFVISFSLGTGNLTVGTQKDLSRNIVSTEWVNWIENALSRT